MAYSKTTWKDQNVEKPRTYSVRDNGDDTVTLLDAFGTVTELGTPVNAENMNKIENGIADLDTNKANDNAVVHLSGTETITGKKTFQVGYNGFILKNTTSYSDLSFMDNSDNFIGRIRCGVNNSNQKYATLFYDVDYVTIKQPTEDTTNSLQVDTVGARNTKLAAGLATKQATITGAATTITSSDLTASRAVIAGSSGKIGVSDTTSTELHYVHGVTSAIQTQINGCVKTTGNQTIGGTKTFSNSPIVPTLGNTDSSTKAATTAYVHNILEALYPVGSLYITTNNSATCPLASLISGSSWSLVAADKALWTSNRKGNTTIDAGLPNITGAFNQQCLMNWTDTYARGALYQGTVDNQQRPQNAGGTDGGNNLTIAFDASKSNSIYGKSSTVQPPAYRVNVWRRTA